MTDIRVPNLGESVTEATIAQWYKSEGDTVAADEPLVELETDKVTVEVPAPAAGTLSEIAAKDGETVEVGALLGQIAEGAGASASGAAGSGGASSSSEGAQQGKVEDPQGGQHAGAGAEAAEREGSTANAPPSGGNGAAPTGATASSDASASGGGAATEVRVPSLGESVTEATVARILKSEGEAVSADEPLVELETDKVSVEVPAPSAGTVASLAVKEGDTVEVGGLLGTISGGAAPSAGGGERPSGDQPARAEQPKRKDTERHGSAEREQARAAGRQGDMPPAPSARKAMADAGLSQDDVAGTGRRGQILKEDVLKAIEGGVTAPPSAPSEAPAQREARAPSADADREERVTMTRLRRTIAKRLKDAQNTAAMLTTFNDVDMSAVMQLRKEYKDTFEKKHGVKLGFMGFFAKACVQALRDVPAVNAEIDGNDLVYKNYYHLGIAVGTDKGLVVPVVRDADRLSFAEIEKTITDFGRRARDGQLKLEEMQGGTFTITNGGIYGSLMSTPILNAPQSGILGMHRIEQRPVATDGKVEVRPMMYLAVSYDHRVVDGKEAVTFLVRIKEAVEDPQRLLLDL
ncbi:2-oxoglutarate dehydrogenase complex dihydrolipoyllysine-residue succinyltransferase [Acuticoccus sp.]|uniref:2-oxoglutarate dehydrogenase complex dihydrolipoyllysine-residue succinyltransferase n=1 Tax=Acuticoccus sp. TaxID=1904378 RepID=UPI003B52AF67